MFVLFAASCSVRKGIAFFHGKEYPVNSTTFIENPGIENAQGGYVTLTSDLKLYRLSDVEYEADRFGNIVGQISNNKPNISIPYYDRNAPINPENGDSARFYLEMLPPALVPQKGYPAKIIARVDFPGGTLEIPFSWVDDGSGIIWYRVDVLTKADYANLSYKKNIHNDEGLLVWRSRDKDYNLLIINKEIFLIDKVIAKRLYLDTVEIFFKKENTVEAISKKKYTIYYPTERDKRRAERRAKREKRKNKK